MLITMPDSASSLENARRFSLPLSPYSASTALPPAPSAYDDSSTFLCIIYGFTHSCCFSCASVKYLAPWICPRQFYTPFISNAR